MQRADLNRVTHAYSKIVILVLVHLFGRERADELRPTPAIVDVCYLRCHLIQLAPQLRSVNDCHGRRRCAALQRRREERQINLALPLRTLALAFALLLILHLVLLLLLLQMFVH